MRLTMSKFQIALVFEQLLWSEPWIQAYLKKEKLLNDVH